MTSYPPDLTPPYDRIPLVHDTTDLFDPETQTALDLRYAAGGDIIPSASTTVQGVVELATNAETVTGTDTARAVTPAALQNKLDLLPYRAVNTQIGTTYTPDLTDVNKIVLLDNASPITVTIPAQSSISWENGHRIDFAQTGVGVVTFVGAGGVSVNATPSLVLRARYSAATAIRVGNNIWLIVGDLA